MAIMINEFLKQKLIAGNICPSLTTLARTIILQKFDASTDYDLNCNSRQG